MLNSNTIGKHRKISPCALKLLTPALSSFGEEKEQAVATFTVQGSMRERLRRILSSFWKERKTSSRKAFPRLTQDFDVSAIAKLRYSDYTPGRVMRMTPGGSGVRMHFDKRSFRVKVAAKAAGVFWTRGVVGCSQVKKSAVRLVAE